MNTTRIRDEHRALTDALLGILGGLRGHHYGRFRVGAEEDLLREAEGFEERLAGHLECSEEAIFPTLRKSLAGFAGDIEELENDHRLLGLYARDLAAQIREREWEAAYEVARSFVGVLLDHLRREAADVGRWTHSLDGPDAERLSALIERKCPPVESQPHLE